MGDRLWRGDKFYERMFEITAAYLMERVSTGKP
jgi:hypothetical protein